MNAVNALRNYHLLALLNDVSGQFYWYPRPGLRIVDVGSKNFYYAQALHAFFEPQSFVGIELDGWHLYRGFYTNASYADFYIKPLPNTNYQVMNFKSYHQPTDGIVWCFPFVIKEDVLDWYLPLHTFEPETLFHHAAEILSPKGFMFMINSGEDEFEIASDLLCRAGFSQAGMTVYSDGLLTKKITPTVSLWIRTEAA